MHTKSIPIYLGIIFSISFYLSPQHIFASQAKMHSFIKASSDFLSSPIGYSPSQIRHAYGVDLVNANGENQVIGIVDAYDDPKISEDLKAFNEQYKLTTIHGLTDSCTIKDGPHPCFQKVITDSATKPNKDWSEEISLDTEWSHAISPSSDILLVETKDSSINNLLTGIDTAIKYKATVTSMSWGGDEYSSEALDSLHFKSGSSIFVASSGDNGSGTSFPAISPDVISVGGTSLSLNSTGNLLKSESAWSGSGGGISKYFKAPLFQIFLGKTNRSNPDISLNADPNYGYSVIDSYKGSKDKSWIRLGGTSAGAPELSGLIAVAKSMGVTLDSSSLYLAYSKHPTAFNNITQGSNGICGQLCNAKSGFDWVTGLGSPKTQEIFNYLK